MSFLQHAGGKDPVFFRYNHTGFLWKLFLTGVRKNCCGSGRIRIEQGETLWKDKSRMEMEGKMRIAVCDDEEKVREVLAEKIKRFCPEAEILCYASGEKLLLAEKAPDIVFLDIQMPGTDGMETAGVLRKRHKRMILIFVTAMEDYVFRAFDVGAFHYLVKPFSQQKFEAVLLGALEQYREFAQAPEGGRGQEEEKGIMILSGGSHIKVCLQDIIYAEVFNRKVVIHKMAEDMEYYGLGCLLGAGFQTVADRVDHHPRIFSLPPCEAFSGSAGRARGRSGAGEGETFPFCGAAGDQLHCRHAAGGFISPRGPCDTGIYNKYGCGLRYGILY